MEVNAKKMVHSLDRKFEVDGLEQTGPRQLQKVLVAGTTRLPHQLEQIGFNIFKIYFLLKMRSLRREKSIDQG